MATVDTIIENAITLANEEKTQANQAANDAMTASQGYAWIDPGTLVFDPEAIEPDVPQVQNSTNTYEAQLDALVALLSHQLASFFSLYYPLASDAFDEATNWILNEITNGGTGINAAVEAQIYGRGRDRVIADGTRTQSAIIADFAARGHQLPPGAMSAKLKEARHAQLAALGNLARDTVIDAREKELATIRFAVEKAIDSRTAAMQAASDYIRAIMSAPEAAARVAMLNTDVQAKMISSTADLYRSRLARDELILKSREINIDAQVRAGGINVGGFYNGVDARVRAAVGAASVYGNAAGAALSSLNSLASKAEVTNL